MNGSRKHPTHTAPKWECKFSKLSDHLIYIRYITKIFRPTATLTRKERKTDRTATQQTTVTPSRTTLLLRTTVLNLMLKPSMSSRPTSLNMHLLTHTMDIRKFTLLALADLVGPLSAYYTRYILFIFNFIITYSFIDVLFVGSRAHRGRRGNFGEADWQTILPRPFRWPRERSRLRANRLTLDAMQKWIVDLPSLSYHLCVESICLSHLFYLSSHRHIPYYFWYFHSSFPWHWPL